jgi:hypothetical protein
MTPVFKSREKCDDATILRVVLWDGGGSADYTHRLLEVTYIPQFLHLWET